MMSSCEFHLLRPEWLLCLPLLFAAAWLMMRRKLFSRSWQSVIDAQLLPHVLLGKPGKASRLPLVLFVVVGSLAIIALSGPVWQQLPQPVYRQQSALIIALDLSRSMDAADIKPSRLARARYKIADILQLRRQGQSALIAYAGSAFTVTPLTDDADTIAALLPSLTTDIMPVQGSRTDLALQQAAQLFNNAGIARGDVLLITDAIDKQHLSAIDSLRDLGHRVSILAPGTTDGAPVPMNNGGFLKDAAGAIVIPRLEVNSLRNAALSTGGRFSTLSSDDRDIKHLLGLLDSHRPDTGAQQTDMQADVWREEGPWLLLLAIPLAALGFRRGYLALLIPLLLPYSPPAEALSWDSLWKNADQLASEQLQQGNASEAAQTFNDAQWKAAAHYRAGEYAQAEQLLQGMDSATAHYNRGNALAQQNRLQEAIAAYDQALRINPQMEDAIANKQLLEQQMQQQQKQQNKDETGDSNGDTQSDADQSSAEQQPSNDGQQQDAPPQSQQDQQPGEHQQDADNRETEQQAQQQAEKNAPPATDQQLQETARQAEATEQQELSQQAAQQWLRRIPDDPGGLLRRKFEYQYKRRQQPPETTQPW